MYAVGIDVSKGKSMVAIASPGGKLYCKPFTVNHKPSELNKLATLLKSLGSETKTVMEHTGRYYEPVANYLYNENLFVISSSRNLLLSISIICASFRIFVLATSSIQIAILDKRTERK